MRKYLILVLIVQTFVCCSPNNKSNFYQITSSDLKDKIKGAWAAQTIGVTYGGPTEFRYLKRIIPDSIDIKWTDSTLINMMKFAPGLYDDIYMDLTLRDLEIHRVLSFFDLR